MPFRIQRGKNHIDKLKKLPDVTIHKTTKPTSKKSQIAPFTGSSRKLETTYYVDNFNYLITYVADHFEALLTTKEQQFFESYKKLSANAQRLFSRMVLRTSAHLRVSKLQYTEINIPTALEELQQAGFIHPCTDSIEHCLPLFTQKELSAALGVTSPALATNEAVNWGVPDLFGDSPASKLFATDNVIEVNFKSTILTYRLLFFGNLHQDFSSFVLRDLGYQRFESYKIDCENRLFKDRKQIDAHLAYYQCIETFDTACEPGADTLVALHKALPTRIQNDKALCRRLDRLNNKIARQLERESAAELAIEIYNKSTLPPARERLSRLHAKNGGTLQALTLCRQIIQSPHDTDELDFALSFGQKLAIKMHQSYPEDNKYKPPESSLALPRSNLSVEFSVATHLAKTGKCYYLENNLISGVFGLAFWDIIFAPVNGVFFHPFQNKPADFYEPDFVSARKALIQKRLTEITEGRLTHLVNHYQYHKRGIQNPLVNWSMCRKHILDLALKRIPSHTWTALFKRILTDIRNYRSGQPDLIWFPDNGGYQFIEVKAPGDKIQKNQLRWMKEFDKQNIPHLIVNVEWLETPHEEV